MTRRQGDKKNQEQLNRMLVFLNLRTKAKLYQYSGQKESIQSQNTQQHQSALEKQKHHKDKTENISLKNNHCGISTAASSGIECLFECASLQTGPGTSDKTQQRRNCGGGGRGGIQPDLR